MPASACASGPARYPCCQPASSRSSSTPTGFPARISSRAASTLPKTPGQDAARPLGIVDVAEDALAQWIAPGRDGAKARVGLPDRLVAEVEQVGVEERQVVVRLAGAGHVRADRPAVAVRVVLVLDPDALAERLRREARDIAGREDVVGPRRARIRRRRSRRRRRGPRLGELDVRDDAEPGDDGVGGSGAPVAIVITVSGPFADTRDARAGPDGDAALAVLLGHGRREIGREVRQQIPGSGTTIVTSRWALQSAAASSEPMKPPPITANRMPRSSLSARVRR